jgi:hypothetical protein
MTISRKANAGESVAATGAILMAMAMLGTQMGPASPAEPTEAVRPPTVAAGGVTLRSVSVEFPDPGRTFPGAADAANNNCLACHSAGMVLTQPRLSRADWQAEVNKMRTVYKAPIADADVPAIVDYLATLGGGNGP